METDLSMLDDMTAFVAMCDKLATQAELQNEMGANGVWLEVADMEESVVLSTLMPTVVVLGPLPIGTSASQMSAPIPH